MLNIRDVHLNSGQLAILVENTLKRLIEKLHDEKKISSEDVKHLLQPEILKYLASEVVKSSGLNKMDLTLRGLQEHPEVMGKILLVCTTAIILEKNFRLEKKPGMSILDTCGLQKLTELEENAKNQLKMESGNQPQLTFNLDRKKALELLALTDAELSGLQAGLEKAQVEMQDLLKTPELKPSGAKQQTNAMVTSLYGLLSPETGTLAIAVTYEPGNFNSVVDVNPNHGLAFIDSINSINDTYFGDSQGFNEKTMLNYFTQGETVTDGLAGFLDDMRGPLSTPSLLRGH